MDALIVSVPFVGHLNPLLALGRELHARGHRVAVASLASARAHVAAEAQELSFIDLGADEDLRTAMHSVLEDASRDPNVARGTFRLGRGLLEMWPRMFDALSVGLSADRPRVIVADLSSPAGICAAQEHQIPLVVNDCALLHMLPMAVLPPAPHVPLAMTGRSIQRVGMVEQIFAGVAPLVERIIARLSGERRLNQFRQARGLPPIDMGGRLKATRIIVDDAFGFEYERALPPTVTMVGPMWSRAVPPLSSDEAAWLADGPPMVYANLGTVAVPDAKQLAAMRDAFDATTFRVLWVLRAAHAASLQGPLPPNVSLLEWGPPPRAVLASPHVKAFVSHCGPNSVRESLSVGTPIVGIPFFADQLDVAVRVADTGAGVWLWKHTFTAPDLRRAIEKVLGDDSYDRRARAVQDAFARAGGVTRAADLVLQAMSDAHVGDADRV